MLGLTAGLWGLFGGFAVEGLEFYSLLRRDGRWPWQPPKDNSALDPAEVGLRGYLVGEIIRLLIGAGLAWAAASTGQISGPLGALGVGAAAPTIVGQLTKSIALTTAPSAPQPIDRTIQNTASYQLDYRGTPMLVSDNEGDG
ncbi:hypothetical protein ABIA31_008915 [Catenulispora sp. MAP5-51]|uniref:hypothetical protein n=1 Tax=Catenulispora sp. MAP5-51 TaxID=3156298 RepID=UPI0035181B08